MQLSNFDATSIAPQQMGSSHPPANAIPFVITNTYGQETKEKTGCMLCIQFTSQLGNVIKRYNLINPSEAAMEIGKKELSALCHATGVFKLSILDANNQMLPYPDWAREIRNARGVMDVGFQDGSDKFTEVKKVYDQAGNEPGKGPAAAPQTQQGGGWSQPGNAAQGNPPQSGASAQGGGWQQPGATQAPAQQQAAPANAGGWQPGPNTGGGPAGAPPPWAGGGQK